MKTISNIQDWQNEVKNEWNPICLTAKTDLEFVTIGNGIVLAYCHNMFTKDLVGRYQDGQGKIFTLADIMSSRIS